MINGNEGQLVNMNTLAGTAATSSNVMSFDTLGFDNLNLYVACGSHATTAFAITEVLISDDDTETAASSQTDIAALCSATATSTGASNVLPAIAVMGDGGIVTELQIDLRKRKRYIGVEVTTGVVAAVTPVAVVGRLTRSGQSADTAAEKAGIDLADTDYSGCRTVVSG